MSKIITQRQHTVKLAKESSDVPAEVHARTAEGEAFSQLVVQVFRLSGLLTAAGDALAKPAGQTTARWRVMAAIEGKPLTVAQIGRAWGLARQSVQRVADMLVQDGLAIYQENPHHRRAQLLVLTPQGFTALQKIQATQLVWANAMGARTGEADLRLASDILTRVIKIVAGG